jgi:hypothetical protein
VRRGLRGNAEKCKANGVLVFGYQINQDDIYEPDPIYAPYVTEAFARRASGQGKTDIADWLNSEGVKTIRGNKWGCNNVCLLLRNEKYVGTYRFGGVVKEGGMAALVDADVFWRVNGMKMRTHNKSEGGLLCGKLYCACGRNMVGTAGTSQSGKVYHYYACSGNLRTEKACKARRIPTEKLEDIIFDVTVSHFGDENLLMRILDALEARAQESADYADVDALKAARRENERRQRNLLGYLEAEGHDSDVRERLERLRLEHAAFTGRILSQMEALQPPTRDFMRFYIEDLLFSDEDDNKRKERILGDFVSRVEVSETHITVEFNYKSESGNLEYSKIPVFAEISSGRGERI